MGRRGVIAVPDSGVDLGVDIYRLWLAGSKYLPDVAVLMENALAHVGHAGTSDAAFVRPAVFGGGVYGPAYGPMGELRDLLAEMLAQTATALRDSGAALVLAADEYQKTDEEARDMFNRMRRGGT
ncbi:hypothetical protein Drose_13120 [Dactylosporangium roseum]|uniref:Uncharacterized protein n=1 Tax=Dactylosporangium roseum TaxID=47989 RepID=A0ABY5ZDM3_9ACTN|nr:hypothetical protein [Dactylosporangium roseum]UWZ39075.1 hypothetical protein Drose_13120 [Dactylosporangium roseum]